MDKFCPKSTKKTVHIKTINDSNYRFLMHGKGEKMKKSVRKKGWFKRISAVIMAVALILSGLYIPDGLFAVKAKAAESMSATWTYEDTNDMIAMVITLQSCKKIVENYLIQKVMN